MSIHQYVFDRRHLASYDKIVMIFYINFQIPKESIRVFAKEGKVPEISSDLLYSTKQGRSRKMKWKQNKHCLKGVGIYSVGESKKGSKLELSASLDHRLYTPIIASIKDSEIPNKYCFIMKVGNLHEMASSTHAFE